MTTCLGICPRTNFAAYTEKEPRQFNSTRKIIEFPIRITLPFLFIMKDHYILSI